MIRPLKVYARLFWARTLDGGSVTQLGPPKYCNDEGLLAGSQQGIRE